MGWIFNATSFHVYWLLYLSVTESPIVALSVGAGNLCPVDFWINTLTLLIYSGYFHWKRTWSNHHLKDKVPLLVLQVNHWNLCQKGNILGNTLTILRTFFLVKTKTSFHHVLSARIFLTLSRYTPLLSITSGRSSSLLHVSAQSCCI